MNLQNTQLNRLALSMLRATLNVNDTNSFLTGSRVYAVPDENSDFDVCVSMSEKSDVIQRLDELGVSVKFSKYYDNIKFHLNEVLYNLIFLNEVNYHAWKKATVSFQTLNQENIRDFINGNVFVTKKVRYTVFQNFVVAFGGELPTLLYDSEDEAVLNV